MNRGGGCSDVHAELVRDVLSSGLGTHVLVDGVAHDRTSS